MNNPFSLGRWLWEMYYAKRDMDNLTAYIHEKMIENCSYEFPVSSKKIWRRYGFDSQGQSSSVFAIIEKYYEQQKVNKDESSS